MSKDRYVDKEDVVYIHSGILLSHKKKEISPPPAHTPTVYTVCFKLSPLPALAPGALLPESPPQIC